MRSSEWSVFWEGQKNSFSSIMVINTSFFAAQIEKRFALKPTDQILDYGCGPGFLAGCLAPSKIYITGADINKYYITQSQNAYPGSKFIHITTDTAQNKRIFDEHFKQSKFDFIVLLSVVQYFKTAEDMDNVVKLLLPYASDSGKIVIADVIDENTSAFRDAFSLFSQCIKRGKTVAFFRFMLYLMSSSYRKISRQQKLFKLSERSIHKIASDNSLRCEKVAGLTIHSTRTNYILTKR